MEHLETPWNDWMTSEGAGAGVNTAGEKMDSASRNCCSKLFSVKEMKWEIV